MYKFDWSTVLEPIFPLGETAALNASPTTPLVKLGAFLLAVGLQVAAGKAKEGKNISASFAKQLEAVQSTAKLTELGFKPMMFKAFDNPNTVVNLIPDMKLIVRNNIANDPDFDVEDISFLRFALNFAQEPDAPKYIDRARVYATKISPAFLRNFDKVSTTIFDTVLGAGDSSKTADLYDELHMLMAKILGRTPKKDEFSIPADVLKRYRERGGNIENQTALDYNTVKRQITVSYDLDFASFMAKQSEKMIPVKKAYDYMKSLGYKTHRILKATKNIPLMVGVEAGKIQYYTDQGLPLQGGIPADADIQFSRTFDPKTGTGSYLSYQLPTSNGPTRLYTLQHHSQSVQTKFDKADKVFAKIDKFTNQWRRDLTSPLTTDKMGACVGLMAYLTGMRIGSRQNSAASMTGVKTYGAISLRVRHITLGSNKITLQYEGKAAGKTGLKQKHIIRVDDVSTKKLKTNLEQFMKGKARDDLVFSWRDRKGELEPYTYHAFQQYLEKSGYPPAGIHKLRTVRGTQLVQQQLKKNTWKPSAKANTLVKQQAEAENFIIDKVITPATKLLGHKSGTGSLLWRTTVKSYVNPNDLLEWFKEKGLRKPKWLPTKVEKMAA